MQLYDMPKKTSLPLFTAQGNCIALPFSQAFSTYGPLLSKTFSLLVNEEKDPHALLTHATHEEGFFLYVPPSHIVEEASLTHILGPQNTVERLHIVVGKNAEIHLSDTYERSNNTHIAHTTFEVEEGGKLFFHSLNKTESSHISSYRIFLKKNAACTTTFLHEAPYSKISLKVNLLEEGARLSYTDFSNIKPLHVSERFTHVTHDAQHTISKKYVKKIVLGRGSSLYKGTVILNKNSAKSQARQMHKALSLEKDAHVHCSPLFTIEQKDVQATHGSTISSFDDDFLFYIRSRSLNELQAKELFLKAFLGDIINLFPPSQREYFV